MHRNARLPALTEAVRATRERVFKPALYPLIKRRVPHISLVFREMWDTAGLPLKPAKVSTTLSGCLDKEKGFVKGEDILSGAEHRLLSTSESVGPRHWDITVESLFWWIAPPNHGYDRNYYHDSSIRTSSRRVCAEVGNTGGVSKALAPSSA